jgi:hypothetical protein
MKTRIVALSISIMIALAFAGNSTAATVSIGGKHSKSEIKKKCAASGGNYGSASNGEYWCDKPGGNEVSCKKNGKCVGIIMMTAPSGGVTVEDPGQLLAK